MGAAVGVGVGELAGVAQNWHYGSRQDSWARLSYELAHQGMRLDLLNSVREEIRDQVTVIISSLDNLMVVATLMLSIGFGLVGGSAEVVPLIDPDDGLIQKALREAYAVLSALTLVFPFWCLIFTLRMRYEVDQCLGRHMEDLQSQLCNVLRKRAIQPPVEHRLRRRGNAALARRSLAPRMRGPGSCASRMTYQAGKLGNLNFQAEIKDVEEYQIVLWAKEDLLQKLDCYHFYYPLAQLTLWMGMLSVLLTCSVVQGLHFHEHFMDEPWMWWSYSSIVSVSCFLSILFMGWMIMIGSITSGHRVRQLTYAHSEPGTPCDAAGLEPEKPPWFGYGSTTSAGAPLREECNASDCNYSHAGSDVEQPATPSRRRAA